jgi:hypothetical protein
MPPAISNIAISFPTISIRFKRKRTASPKDLKTTRLFHGERLLNCGYPGRPREAPWARSRASLVAGELNAKLGKACGCDAVVHHFFNFAAKRLITQR